MAVSFANIFMAEIETKLIQQNEIKPILGFHVTSPKF